MAREYIVTRRGAEDAVSTLPSRNDGQSGSQQFDLSRFPVIASLLRDFAEMSEASPRSGKGSGRRGRKAHAKVPCDDCIARASRKTEPAATLELCEKCTAALHRPRGRKQQEQANTRKVRKQSHAVVDTALGIPAEPVAMPCESIPSLTYAMCCSDGHMSGRNTDMGGREQRPTRTTLDQLLRQTQRTAASRLLRQSILGENG